MYLNPAKTGDLEGYLVNVQQRNQWPKLNDGGDKITNVGIQKSIEKYNSGVGVNFLHENTSKTFFNTQLGVLLAKRFTISENFELGLGTNLEMRQSRIDIDNLTFGSDSGNVNSTVTNFNFTLGVDFKVFNLNFGYKSANLNQPNISFFDSENKLPIRHQFYALYKYQLNDKVIIKPIINFINQKSFSHLMFATSAIYKNANITMGIRNNDIAAFIIGTGFKLKRVGLQYTYDYNFGNVSNSFTGGTHEIGFHFRFGSKNGYEDDFSAY